MIHSTLLVSVVLGLIFCFALTNGFLDGGGIVSTVITTRVLEPLPALVLVASCEVIGVSLFGHAVVKTIGLKMISFPAGASSKEILLILLAGVAGALAWNSAMWRLSWPSSSSHALLGGLLGATWSKFVTGAINLTVVLKVLIGLALVPLLAVLLGFILARALYWVGEYLSPAISGLLRALHIIVLSGIALAHGSNDGQKSLALVLLALVAVGWHSSSGAMPIWISLLCGLALGLGVIFGSRQTVQTVGQGFYRVQNLQGLCAETTAMMLVGASSLAGFPMATSHVMSGAVLGAGAAVQVRRVRWDLAGDITLAWIFTIPAAGIISMGLSYVVSKAF
jgi:PiT family inorganic phosphate transporter